LSASLRSAGRRRGPLTQDRPSSLAAADAPPLLVCLGLSASHPRSGPGRAVPNGTHRLFSLDHPWEAQTEGDSMAPLPLAPPLFATTPRCFFFSAPRAGSNLSLDCVFSAAGDRSPATLLFAAHRTTYGTLAPPLSRRPTRLPPPSVPFPTLSPPYLPLSLPPLDPKATPARRHAQVSGATAQHGRAQGPQRAAPVVRGRAYLSLAQYSMRLARRADGLPFDSAASAR